MSKRSIVGALLGFMSYAQMWSDINGAIDRYAVVYKPKRKKFKPSRQRKKRK